ncbi:MAG: hypothetical protein ACR2H4_07465 [Pyrinomonadaceae bacterium]
MKVEVESCTFLEITVAFNGRRQYRFVPRLLLALGMFSLLSGCDPRPNSPVVGGVRSDRVCGTCFESKRDNPIIQAQVTLGTTTAAAGTFVEVAERTNAGFRYDNLRVDASSKGDNRLGSTDLDITPNPSILGFWTPTDAAPAMVLPLELHGIELGYALSEVNISRQAATGGRSTAPQSPVKVSLDPTVMLVPVQVIRVVPDSPEAPYASNLAKFTKAVHKRYWDDRWDLDTARISEPSVPNKGSFHTVNNTVLAWTSADEVWSQCGIQFRMITCPGSNEGCPNLVVEDPAQVAATSCIAGRSPESSKNWTEAEALPGVNRDLPIITFAWRVTQAGCPVAHVAKGGRAAMGYGLTHGGDLSLAHELGHVLGLEDFKDCKGDGKHLMCNEDGEDAPRIRPEDCLKARTNAARYVKRHWQTDVVP